MRLGFARYSVGRSCRIRARSRGQTGILAVPYGTNTLTVTCVSADGALHQSQDDSVILAVLQTPFHPPAGAVGQWLICLAGMLYCGHHGVTRPR
jgi:hypothetical protein